MKFTVLLATACLIGSITTGCGKDEDKKVADVVNSCEVPNMIGEVDLASCLEATNADPASFQATCKDSLNGTYAAAACTVAAGTKGCSKTNANGVPVVTWYKGSGWTADTLADACKDEGETSVTK